MSMETKQGKRGRIRKWESMKLNILCMSDVEFRLFVAEKKMYMSNTVKENYFVWSLFFANRGGKSHQNAYLLFARNALNLT